MSTTSTTSFKADISQLKAAMQQASRSVRLAESEFKAATAGMDDWSQSADGLTAKLKQLKTTLSAQKSQLGLLEEQLEKTESEYGKNSAAADRVRMSINNMKASIAKTEKQIDDYSDELSKAEKYGDGFNDTLEEMDKASEQASDGFTVMKGALASLVADGIRLAVNGMKELISSTVEVGSTFEKSMSNVQALSGATNEEMQFLTDTAKEFGSSTQFSASEAADALSYMALAGWDAQTSADALGGVLDLAAASGMELASASDMVTDYMSAFNMEAKDSAYFADLLAYAQANANTTAEGLGEAFKNSAANLNAAGQDIETVTSLISMMANQGLKGSEAGTALSAVMRDISKKMENGAISVGEATVAVQDAQGNYRDLTDILKDVEKATNGMGDAEKSAALLSTFTADSIKGLNLILNAGVDNAADFEEQLRNCQGAASDAAKTMNDNLAGDLTALNSKIEGTKIEVYESLVPALRDGVAELSGLIDEFDWDEVGKKLGDITKKVIEFGKTAIENADGIIDVVKSVGSVLAVTFVATKILQFSSAISGLYTTFKTLKTATDAATTSQLLLNAAEAATPIGLVTAAVAGLTAGVIYLATKNDEATDSTYRLTEAEQDQIDKVEELVESYRDVKSARDESVDAINSEFAYYQKLSDELDSLVDANGQVKAGYEDRVNFILNTLNEACGTEMKLIDGVIENYKEEKQAIDDLINSKKAEAVLRANEEAYTQAIQGQSEALQTYIDAQEALKNKKEEVNRLEKEAADLANMGIDAYAKQAGLSEDMGYATERYRKAQEDLNNQIKESSLGIGELYSSFRKAESAYVGYETTIKNYEGLSAAIISGDQQKINDALSKQTYDFQTAETGTKQTLQAQVSNLKEHYETMKQAVEDGAPSVTQEMVDEAAKMVEEAENELSKLPDSAEKVGKETGQLTAKGIESTKNQSKKAGEDLKKSAVTGAKDDGSMKKEGQTEGKSFASGVESEKGSSRSAGKSLGKEAKSGIDSVDTTQSGKNFTQGFINGMNSLFSTAVAKAKSLGKSSTEGLKEGQKEGSPSKITYQSGIYFVQGYINGIISQSSALKQTIKNMVASVVSELSNINNYDFDTVAETASTAFSSALDKKFNYTLSRISYENEQKLAEFDSTIEQLTASETANEKKLQSASDKKVKAIESTRDKKVKALQKKIDKLGNNKEDKAQKKKLQNEIKDIKEKAAKKINAEKNSVKKQIENSKKTSEELINTEKANKEAYQKASSEMISSYSDAMKEYQNQAQKLIDDTIGGITEKYNQRYDELIDKQDNLISKLKSAGELFNVSSAGIMTLGDIKEQTRQIKDYANKLQTIKQNVSSELFDEIASFDIKEGSAYMDRLLAMSTDELKAYNEAYSEKLKAAQELGESIYKADFDQVSAEYQSEINQAFNNLPSTLEALGTEAMKGFINGLTENTDYMSDAIRTYIASMIDTFRSELDMHSPSRVLESLGDLSGTGFVDGFKSTIKDIRSAALKMAKEASVPLEGFQAQVGGSRVAVSRQNGIGSNNSSIVNNYNLVQNNTSPKSLSALETYQARREQIAMIRALT